MEFIGGNRSVAVRNFGVEKFVVCPRSAIRSPIGRTIFSLRIFRTVHGVLCELARQRDRRLTRRAPTTAHAPTSNIAQVLGSGATRSP